jgi:hypothetical protein
VWCGDVWCGVVTNSCNSFASFAEGKIVNSALRLG